MSKSQRFSLSRFFQSVLERGSPTNFDLDSCNELARPLSPHWKTKRGEAGYLVPSSAFDSPVTQDVTIGGSGVNLIGRKVQQLTGAIGWSACVNSGAQILGPFRSSDVMVYHDSALPPVSWQPEIGAVVPADPSLT